MIGMLAAIAVARMLWPTERPVTAQT
jgi:hypothetical protein